MKWKESQWSKPRYAFDKFDVCMFIVVFHLCFLRYINALEAASLHFATNTSREMLRSQQQLKEALESDRRHSNSEYSMKNTSDTKDLLS